MDRADCFEAKVAETALPEESSAGTIDRTIWTLNVVTQPRKFGKMSILVNRNTRVITQGMTGETGTFHTRRRSTTARRWSAG